ncbi:MAG: antibiotic biosynthesis monooxygenase [Saprospiraceae bacterium]|jgi:heme-degrading monooxygenase HmoA
MIASTPAPPYYAVIFTSIRTNAHPNYAETAQRMVDLAAEQDGFLGLESTGNDELSITVSYWRDEASILKWKKNSEHQLAQEMGRSDFYQAYHTRVCKVERAYGFTTTT